MHIELDIINLAQDIAKHHGGNIRSVAVLPQGFEMQNQSMDGDVTYYIYNRYVGKFEIYTPTVPVSEMFTVDAPYLIYADRWGQVYLRYFIDIAHTTDTIINAYAEMLTKVQS